MNCPAALPPGSSFVFIIENLKTRFTMKDMKLMKLRINELPGCSAARQFIRLYH